MLVSRDPPNYHISCWLVMSYVYVADLYTVDFVDKWKYIMCVASL